MSSKSSSLVLQRFSTELEGLFRFLVADFGFTGPEYRNEVLQVASYVRPGMRCRIMLDHTEMSVETRIEVESGDSVTTAGLDMLVEAAGIESRNRVPGTVHSLKTLRKVLSRQANLLRLLLPYLEPETVADLMERAGARHWRAR